MESSNRQPDVHVLVRKDHHFEGKVVDCTMSLSEISVTFGKALDVPFDLSGQGGQY